MSSPTPWPPRSEAGTYPSCANLSTVVRRLILASASAARLGLLRSSGLDPEVVVSNVEENGVDHLPPGEAVTVLARRKARAVADRVARAAPGDGTGALVIGCDSMLEFEGHVWGKAMSAAEVTERWTRLRGREGRLHTGHCVIDTGASDRPGGGLSTRAATDSAVVRFGCPSDREIEAYSTTPEALSVAGPFTLEGRSGPWVDSIDGNIGTVFGISLVVIRRLLGEMGIEVIDLWA